MDTPTTQLLHLRLKHCYKKGEQEDYKSLGTREFAERLCLVEISEAASVKPHQHKLNKYNNRHENVNKEKLMKS